MALKVRADGSGATAYTLYSVIYDYAAEYNERFGQIFPIARLKINYKYSEILDIAEKCLEQGKDVYAMGFLK